jgi:FAD/FMN-containing dehydrogenase
MEFLASLFLIASVLTRQALAVTSQQILTDLSSVLSNTSQVIVTTDASYRTDFTQRWSIYSQAEPTYTVAAKPATAGDVQKILQYAARNKVPILATGGGHGYTTTLSGLRNALNVDLSNFKKVAVDASANTMVIGAATTFADMYDPLYAAGKMMRKSPTSPMPPFKC